MKKSEIKQVLSKVCTAYDILSQCYCEEDFKTMCQDDEKLMFRFSLFDCKNHLDFLRARDFVVEGMLESIMRDLS